MRKTLSVMLAMALAGATACGGGSGGADAYEAGGLSCTMEGQAIGCSLAAWLYFPASAGDTPRAMCESSCGRFANGGGEGICGDGLSCGYCLMITGMTCDTCATLLDEPLDAYACDADPCTVDQCSGVECTHDLASWIGEACERTNDLGTCAGVRVCNAVVCPDGWPCGADVDATCDAPEPTLEVPDGVDNDCDGETDEAPGPVFPLSAGTPVQDVDVASLTGGDFAVAWVQDEPLNAGYTLRARVGSPEEPLGGEVLLVSTNAQQFAMPNVAAIAGGGFAVSWLAPHSAKDVGARVRAYEATGAPIGKTAWLPGPEGAHAAGASVGPLASGGWVAAWSASTGSKDVTIRARRFLADGQADGEPVVVAGPGQVGIGPIVAVDGGSAVLWLDGGQSWSTGVSVYMRVLDAGGGVGEAVRLLDPSPVALGTFDRPRAAPLADGGLMLTWVGGDGETRQGATAKVRARAFTWDGVPNGPELTPGGPSGWRGVADVAPLPDGGAALSWLVRDEPGADAGAVYLQRMGVAGATAQRVDLPGLGGAASPSVATLAHGRALVVWIWRAPFHPGDPQGADLRGRILDP